MPSVLAKDSDFAKYLKEEFKEEIEEFLKSDRNTSDGDTSHSDELADAKALYELQSQEGNLDSNLKFNLSLQLARNVELVVLNQISAIAKFHQELWKFTLRHNNIQTIYQVLKIPELKNSNNDLIKFLSTTDLRASNIKPEDVNIKLNDRNHSSPLHLAAQEGSTELVKVLISKGANLEAKDKNGW